MNRFGTVDDICPKFCWDLFWWTDDEEKVWNDQIEDYEYKRNYYLANGDGEFLFDPENDKHLKKLIDEGKVTKVATKDNEYVEAQPKWFIDLGYTDLSTLFWELYTSGSSQIWLPKITKYIE